MRLPPAEPQIPVFIDESGWRRRTLQGLGLAVGCACVGYLLFVGTLVSGFWQPVGTQPPSTNAPAGPHSPAAPSRQDAASSRQDATPSRQDADTSPEDPGAPVPAGARADRDDHRRPPAGRSAPPAGGPKQ
ncbi:hypothetical protein [Streptomyces sp. Je 1-332]|uniref:hypothetical protein n=1 Tax=Streptomyces sp. Je 1-332 TaxID=3231270 RepID=UPI00345A17D2